MSIASCLVKLKDFVAKSDQLKGVSKERLDYFAQKLDAIQADTLNPSQFNVRAQEFIDGDLSREAAQRKAAKAMEMYTRERAIQNIKDNTAQWKTDIQGGQAGKAHQMPFEAMRSWIQGGSLRQGQSSNISMDVIRDSVKAEYQGVFNQALAEVPGLKDVFASESNYKDTLLELGAINKKTQGMQTGNEMARQAAKVLKTVKDYIFKNQQAVNPYLVPNEEFLWKQMHDRDRIVKMGKDSFVGLIMSKAGKKSFPEVTPLEKQRLFGGMFDKIEAGEWGRVTDDAGERGQNIRGRQSQSRKIIFNDDQAFADYTALAGPKSLYDGMTRIINSAAYDQALLEKAGSNPDQTYQGIRNKFERGLKGKDLEYFRQHRNKLDQMWEVAKGAQYAPAYGTVAKGIQGAMTLQYLAHGGMSIFRSTQDAAMAGSLLREFDNSSIASNSVELVGEWAKAMGSSEHRNARLEDLGLLVRSAQQENLRMLGSSDSQPGAMAKAAQLMGSLTLHTQSTDSWGSAFGTLLTKRMGDVSKLDWSKLPESWQTGMGRYGVDENSWNVMRLGTEPWEGRTHLTPEGIRKLPDAAIDNYLRKSGQFVGGDISDKMLDLGRQKLARQLGVMVNENARLASARTDTRQRDFMWGNSTVNDGMGMLRRLAWEFKSATLVQNDVYRRAYFSGQAPKGNLYGVASLIAMNAFLFAVGDVAKQLVQGKTPEDPSSMNYIGKVVAGSAAGGIYLDTLVNMMQEDSIPDKTAEGLKSLAGPVASTGLDLLATGLQAGSELAGHTKPGSAAKSGAKMLVNNFPGQNLFWAKAAFDYHIGNALRNFVGPGYLSYLEKRTKLNKQSYLFGRPTGQSFLDGSQ